MYMIETVFLIHNSWLISWMECLWISLYNLHEHLKSLDINVNSK